MTAREVPLVSVCVPTYNRADRLRRAMERLLACTYPKLEVVISDNASTDHTREVCEELARRDARVRYFRQSVNLGATGNFLFARAQATGQYFLWHADDDFLSADYIARCVQALEADASLVLASGVAAYHRGDERIRMHGNIVQAGAQSWLLRVLRHVFLVEDNANFYGVYRRQAVAHCRLPTCYAADAVWIAEVLMEGRGRVVPTTYVYRDTSDNASTSPASAARAHGAPRWHGRFPWIALPLVMARQLAFCSERMRARGGSARLALFATVFAVSFTKQALQIVLRRLPGGRRIYARCFSSELPI